MTTLTLFGVDKQFNNLTLRCLSLDKSSLAAEVQKALKNNEPLVLTTTDGKIHVLDIRGPQVKVFEIMN